MIKIKPGDSFCEKFGVFLSTQAIVGIYGGTQAKVTTSGINCAFVGQKVVILACQEKRDTLESCFTVTEVINPCSFKIDLDLSSYADTTVVYQGGTLAIPENTDEREYTAQVRRHKPGLELFPTVTAEGRAGSNRFIVKCWQSCFPLKVGDRVDIPELGINNAWVESVQQHVKNVSFTLSQSALSGNCAAKVIYSQSPVVEFQVTKLGCGILELFLTKEQTLELPIILEPCPPKTGCGMRNTPEPKPVPIYYYYLVQEHWEGKSVTKEEGDVIIEYNKKALVKPINKTIVSPLKDFK